jgi:D-glycero-D-manno-heptose 1,7-bisphosphate phosphatase
VSGPGARAVFLDRDGTLIEDQDYPRDPDRVRLLPGVTEALARLSDAGFQLVAISNQSGIGRGIITAAQARAVHERFIRVLAEEGIALQAVKYCPHAPWDGCDCRKPAPGLLLLTAGELQLDLHASYMIGDKRSDVEAGHRAGCRTILLAPAGSTYDRADHVARGWADATEFILSALTPGAAP